MFFHIPPEERSRTRSNLVVLCSGILLTAALIYIGEIWGFINTIIDALMPFIIGFAIAFLLIPIVKRVEWFFARSVFRRKPHPRLARTLATIIAYIVLLALVSAFFAILVPQLITSIKSILQYIASFFSANASRINELLLKLEFLNIEGEQLVISWENINARLIDYVRVLLNNLNNVVAIAGGISSGIYTVVFQLFVGLIAGFYLLLDRETFCAQIKKTCYALFPRPTCERLVYWARRANDIFAGFITGKILDSMIIGAICYVFMAIFRIEYPVLISVIVGMTNIIPFFGPLIGAVPSVLILLLVNPLSALWFLVFIIILQQIDGNLIGPLILGDYVGLSPFWIMLAIIVGSELWGFVGMLVSVPVFALLYAIARTVIDGRLRKRNLPMETTRYKDMPKRQRKDK